MSNVPFVLSHTVTKITEKKEVVNPSFIKLLLFCHFCLLVAYVMEHSIPEIHPDKSVYPSQKALNMQFITKSSGLTLFGGIITVYTENHRTHINSLPAKGKLYRIYLNARRLQTMMTPRKTLVPKGKIVIQI